MKKRIISALLLTCALVIAPVGNIFSTVATASGNYSETVTVCGSGQGNTLTNRGTSCDRPDISNRFGLSRKKRAKTSCGGCEKKLL